LVLPQGIELNMQKSTQVVLRRSRWTVLTSMIVPGLGAWIVTALVGCGDGVSTANPGEQPPHGGTLILLSDGSGMVEVVKKTGTSPMTAEVSFYFYSDAYSPYDPSPQKGVLQVSKQRSVTLIPQEDALVTPEGAVMFANRDVDGILTVELDGISRQIPLGMR
jgi:hypothetical protein